jgi:GT2 family glycosyltransferase
LRQCLAALREQSPRRVEIIVVWQGEERPHLAGDEADQVIESAVPLGFARAVNLGLAASDRPFLATVNDDAIVHPGWIDSLLEALAAAPHAAAAQGVNLQHEHPERIDGFGLAWNRWWQAVQLGHGELLSRREDAVRDGRLEVFGVSATAALFRRQALLRAALGDGVIFDPVLESYYEDTDLACRLRALGYTCLAVPSARARHGGSVTTLRQPARRFALLYGNRHLVAARLLGRAFFPRFPLLLARDLADLRGAAARRESQRARGVVAGLSRAIALLPGYARLGAPAVPLADLARLRAAA